jgi:SAM-dependent methyltransferase
MIDWGLGEYERTAAELEPVAEHVIALASLQAGERLLDLATGTGNLALLAAGTGARVSAIDAAPRLIDVARERADAVGARIEFAIGDLHELPYAPDAFDVVTSVFGLIFADNARAAVDELIRVLAPDGRAYLSAWVPEGPVAVMAGTFGRAIAAATGVEPRRFSWQDPAAVAELTGDRARVIASHDGSLTITGTSPEAYFDESQRKHPMSVAGRPVLERVGTYDEVRAQAVAAFREANQNLDGFRITSPYRVIEIRRG